MVIGGLATDIWYSFIDVYVLVVTLVICSHMLCWNVLLKPIWRETEMRSELWMQCCGLPQCMIYDQNI